jgi:site-specific DNA recombinase
MSTSASSSRRSSWDLQIPLRLFAQRLAGHSVARIARALNEAGVPCPSAADPDRNTHRSGTAWTLGAVTTILGQPSGR